MQSPDQMLSPCGASNMCLANAVTENSPDSSPRNKAQRIEWVLTEEAADVGDVKLDLPK